MAQMEAPKACGKVVELLQAPKFGAYRAQSTEAEVVAPVCFIGGSGGSQHALKAWQDGKRVTKLRVYSGPWQIKAIRIWLSGDEQGDYKEFGKPEGANYREFTFEDGERVEKMSLWGNGAGSRAGWIYFRTNKGKSFDYGMYDWPKKTEYEVNVGSGILVGALYNAGSDIDAHGYYFLSSSVASTQVTDVSYPTLRWDSKLIAPVALDSYTQTNKSSAPISWEFGGSHTVTTSSSWTSSTENTFNVNVSIEAAVPEVVKAGASFGWQLTKLSSHQRSEEHRHDVRWHTNGQLQPGQSIRLVALTRRGNLTVPYTSTATVTLKNGATFRFSQPGTYTGVAFTGVEVENDPGNNYATALVKKHSK